MKNLERRLKKIEEKIMPKQILSQSKQNEIEMLMIDIYRDTSLNKIVDFDEIFRNLIIHIETQCEKYNTGFMMCWFTDFFRKNGLEYILDEYTPILRKQYEMEKQNNEKL